MTTDTQTSSDTDIPESRQRLADNVNTDTDLVPGEKETIIGFSNPDEKARVLSYQTGITRRLIQHPLFEIEWLAVPQEGAKGNTVTPEEYSEGSITGVKGFIPIGALKVRTDVRSASGHAEVVSRPWE